MSIFKTDNLNLKKQKTDSRAHIPTTTAHCWLSGHTVMLRTQPDPQASVLPTGDSTVLEAGHLSAETATCGLSEAGIPGSVSPPTPSQTHHLCLEVGAPYLRLSGTLDGNTVSTREDLSMAEQEATRFSWGMNLTC